MTKSVDEVLASLDKSVRSHLNFASEIEIERLETPSLGLTAALSGGWAMGRMGLVWGPRSAGKSSFILQQLAIAQRKGKIAALFDVERSMDKKWAARLGVDIDQLVVSKSSTYMGFVNDAKAMMQAGVDVIAVDSTSALIPATFVDEHGELKDFEKTGAIGGAARSMAPAVSQLTYANEHDTLLLFISQIRMGPKGGMNWGMSFTGGTAFEHALSQSVRMHASGGKDDRIMGEVTVDDRIVTKDIGRKVTWTVDKDRVGPGLNATDDYTLFFDGDHVGVDKYGEIIKLGVQSGVIKKAGAWYSYGDRQIGQGAHKAAALLREEQDLFDQVWGEISGP